MDINSTERIFIPYPTNRVVGTIADAEHAEAAGEALVEAGFDWHSIDLLHGDEDLSRLDPTGSSSTRGAASSTVRTPWRWHD